jgi:hypothetical protein
MTDSPTESFEHAEHAEHVAHSGDPFLMKVSITIALLAVVAATIGSFETIETAATIVDKNEAVLIQNKVTDNWGFYQAKSIKKNMYEIAAAAGGPDADGFREKARGYGAEEKEISAKGKELERETLAKSLDSERHERRHHFLTAAVTFLHVAIAVATLSIIMRGQRWPWRASIALGIVGSLLAAYAYL